MTKQEPLIAKGTLAQGQLQGKTALITGGGGGIGFEAARALLWLGANVVIAEIDPQKGSAAEEALAAEFGPGRARFFRADISREADVGALSAFVSAAFGQLDILLNNATVTPMGEAHKVGVAAWDRSYAVNLRGPVLLLEAFLPGMLERDSGVVAFVPSSGAAPYMGAYEVFKTAQVELCSTLSAELEGTGVFAYSIGPGLVKTQTAMAAIEDVSRRMGLTMDEFLALNEKHMLTAEEAGAGFAASTAMAQRYSGKEISSIQALTDAGIFGGDAEESETPSPVLPSGAAAALPAAMEKVLQTYREQHAGWLSRNVFERQWVLRDFKKSIGCSADEMKASLEALMEKAWQGSWDAFAREAGILTKLSSYYRHQIELLEGFEKNPNKLAENLAILKGWIDDIGEVLRAFPS